MCIVLVVVIILIRFMKVLEFGWVYVYEWNLFSNRKGFKLLVWFI